MRSIIMKALAWLICLVGATEVVVFYPSPYYDEDDVRDTIDDKWDSYQVNLKTTDKDFWIFGDSPFERLIRNNYTAFMSPFEEATFERTREI